MVNILIADDNLDFSKNLINEISESINIKICKICTNGKEVLKVVKNSNIDIIVLDVMMPIMNGIEVLNELLKETGEQYKNSIIMISGDNCFISQVINNPLVYDFIIKGTRQEKIIYCIKKLVEIKDIKCIKSSIIKELESIGYDLRYKGTIYLTEVILQEYINREEMLDNLQKDIYPIISKIYRKSINNIKCNINNATELMYCKCSINKMQEYFGFHEDIKPTIKTVVNTVLNKIYNGK